MEKGLTSTVKINKKFKRYYFAHQWNLVRFREGIKGRMSEDMGRQDLSCTISKRL